MATEILAVGITAATSGDILVSGSDKAIHLKAPTGEVLSPHARVEVQTKDDAGAYRTFAMLTGFCPDVVLAADGTYRCVRQSIASCGVYSD